MHIFAVIVACWLFLAHFFCLFLIRIAHRTRIKRVHPKQLLVFRNIFCLPKTRSKKQNASYQLDTKKPVYLLNGLLEFIMWKELLLAANAKAQWLYRSNVRWIIFRKKTPWWFTHFNIVCTVLKAIIAVISHSLRVSSVRFVSFVLFVFVSVDFLCVYILCFRDVVFFFGVWCVKPLSQIELLKWNIRFVCLKSQRH